ncbi:MAG: hypothetical protein QM564_12500 [Bergeyella sp.]
MTKQYYEKIFSTQRMEKYFSRYPSNEQKAILHYHDRVPEVIKKAKQAI